MNNQRILLLILIVLILALYARSYGKTKEGYKIIQTTLKKIDLNTLYEKYPIVIYDRVVNPTEIIETIFSFSYTFKHDRVEIVPNICMVTSKYLVLFNSLTDSDLYIINPSNSKNIEFWKKNGSVVSTKPLSESNVQFVTIKLKKNQVIILPAFWSYQTSEKFRKIALDDIFGAIYYGLTKAKIRRC